MVVNKNIVTRISHSEYKIVLLNYRSLRHLMNRIKSKNHKIRIYEVKKFLLSCFDEKIYILSNRYAVSLLGISVNHEATVILITIQNNFFSRFKNIIYFSLVKVSSGYSRQP